MMMTVRDFIEPEQSLSRTWLSKNQQTNISIKLFELLNFLGLALSLLFSELCKSLTGPRATFGRFFFELEPTSPSLCLSHPYTDDSGGNAAAAAATGKTIFSCSRKSLGTFRCCSITERTNERTKAGRWKCFIYLASNQTDGLARSLPSGFSRTFYFK